MTIFADLHLHSKYARATSKNMDLDHISRGATEKGLGIVGTGDFTHPLWMKELKEKLVPSEKQGFFQLRDAKKGEPALQFMLQVEVATFKSTPTKVRKVHHVICVPSFDDAAQVTDLYSKWGNLAADGRPMFASRASAELVERTKEVAPKAVIFPAHIWTPYFGVFGSKSGFDSFEEGYEEQVKHIFCYETGMSADPAMCWRLSKLDNFTPVSFSDSHSFWPWRIGRECTAFADSVNSFEELWKAVKQKDSSKMLFTIETDPNYGIYHWDGHRDCNFSCPPSETKKLQGICPVCKRLLTIGVENRVDELADRPPGFEQKNGIPFRKLLPLHELLAGAYCTSLSSKKVMAEGALLMKEFGSELAVLLEVSKEKLLSLCNQQVVEAIMLNRESRIPVKPGFDGEYGVPQLPSEARTCEPKENSKRSLKSNGAPANQQKSLGDW